MRICAVLRNLTRERMIKMKFFSYGYLQRNPIVAWGNPQKEKMCYFQWPPSWNNLANSNRSTHGAANTSIPPVIFGDKVSYALPNDLQSLQSLECQGGRKNNNSGVIWLVPSSSEEQWLGHRGFGDWASRPTPGLSKCYHSLLWLFHSIELSRVTSPHWHIYLCQTSNCQMIDPSSPIFLFQELQCLRMHISLRKNENWHWGWNRPNKCRNVALITWRRINLTTSWT